MLMRPPSDTSTCTNLCKPQVRGYVLEEYLSCRVRTYLCTTPSNHASLPAQTLCTAHTDPYTCHKVLIAAISCTISTEEEERKASLLPPLTVDCQ